MKSLAPLLLALMGLIQLVYTQNRLDFKSLRYEEEYDKISNDTNRSFLDKIKYISLSDDDSVMMSLGGEVRSQYQYFKNENWGDLPNDPNGFLLNRVLLHLDTKYKKRVRLFAQLQSSTAISRIEPNPLEKNVLDTHQLFIDYKFKSKENNLIVRIGRQEFLYGSQRLISVREGPNSRLAFDAVKTQFKNGAFSIDAFYSYPVVNEPLVFDDHLNQNTKLLGSYAVVKNIPYLKNMDIYYLGLWKSISEVVDVQGSETRHSVGTRIWKNTGNFQYDIEGLYQFGDFNGKSINAWTVSSNIMYQFSKTKFKPTIGLKTEIISGDQNVGDNNIETFNPLFPRGAYFGLAALIGPSNIIDLHPSVNFELTDKWRFALDCDIFWRMSINDGIYAPNMQIIYRGTDTDTKFIGAQISMDTTYDLSRRISIKLEGTWFDSGDFIKESGAGKDILFSCFTTQFKF